MLRRAAEFWRELTLTWARIGILLLALLSLAIAHFSSSEWAGVAARGVMVSAAFLVPVDLRMESLERRRRGLPPTKKKDTTRWSYFWGALAICLGFGVAAAVISGSIVAFVFFVILLCVSLERAWSSLAPIS